MIPNGQADHRARPKAAVSSGLIGGHIRRGRTTFVMTGGAHRPHGRADVRPL